MEAEPKPGPQEKVELVRKVYVRDLKDKDRVHTVFLVTQKQRHLARSGKAFLAVSLADKTGELEARVFDQVEKLGPRFAPGDYLLARGHITTFRGKPQLVLEELERLDPEPIDKAEFTPPPEEPRHDERPEGSRDLAQIKELVQRVHDPFVKKLLVAFLEDPEISAGLPIAPAAKGVHHAYRGGLAQHILSVMRLAHRMADHYPMVDRDLLVAGALLHDVGKVGEISPQPGFEYTDPGRLVGHLVMTAQKIREKTALIEGFPPALEHHLTHLVVSHHGEVSYGSPKPPMTLEALLLHLVDLIDSRVGSWLELMEKDPNERWTELSKLYGRHLWKGPLPTVRNKAPVEPRRRPKKSRKEPRPAEEKPPQDLNFKPFSVLAGENQSPAGDES